MGQNSYTILMMVGLFAVMYFFMIRPENKRKKEAQALRDNLKKGDTITTIGGIVGKIIQVGENTVIIETSDDRVRFEITKWAISTNGVQASNDPNANKGKKAVKGKDAKNQLEAPAETSVEAPVKTSAEVSAEEEK